MTADTHPSEIQCSTPMGTLALRTWCMPEDTNPAGDIFGGWLMGRMDTACALTARQIVKGRTATVAVNGMEFHKPVYVGDVLCCYTKVERIGNTSITIKVEAWVTRDAHGEHLKVTEGVFTFVALNEKGKPRKIEK